ncbi:MAG: AMP-binding protein, partial [Flavobacterium sp.]|nr:AMP-binding protein [Candidatus Neoflavobacterium equi]
MKEQLNFPHYLTYFLHWEKVQPNRVFLQQSKNKKWIKITYKEAGLQMRKIAQYLLKSEIRSGDRVGILSKNCPEWIITDLAISYIKAISVPYYPNLNKEGLQEVLEMCEVKALFIGKIETWKTIKEVIPKDFKIISFTSYAQHDTIDQGVRWEYILATYTPYYDVDFLADPEAIWTILFTSGTTGKPKGAILTNNNLNEILNIEQKYEQFNLKKRYGKKTYFFSILPLNHIGERTVGQIVLLLIGGTVCFSETLETLNQDMKKIQPHVMFSVPHLWTKFQMGVLQKLPQKKLDRFLKIPLLSYYIKRKIRLKLGLNRLIFSFTAAAPTSPELKSWYLKIGIKLREGYGMTETSGANVTMPIDEFKVGSVGKVLPHVQLKIAHQTNEILIHGPMVMKGYYGEPQKTSQVIKDGWMHTGDIGHLDEDAYLFVEGRISDSFKTAKGKYIIPAPIEWKFQNADVLEHLIVVGLGASQPLVLVQLSDMAKSKHVTDVNHYIEQQIKKVNQGLMNYQKIAKAIIIDTPWNIENNFLTPTMKLKRRMVDATYKDYYELWNQESKSIIWV